MTLPVNTTPTSTYLGNGTANVFPFTFRPLTADNIRVTIYDADGVATDLFDTTDYTSTYLLFPLSGGEITLVNLVKPYLAAGKLAAGYSIFIEYLPVLDQERRFKDYGPHAPIEIEKYADQTTSDMQAINAKVDRALTIPGGGTVNPVLPPFIGGARKILRVNDTEDGISLGPTVDSIFTALADAQTAADESEASAVAANGSALAAAASAVLSQAQVALAADQVVLAVAQVGLAQTARVAAEAQVPLAAAQVALATTQAELAEDWSILSKQYAETTLYDSILELDSAVDSPYVITIADKDRIFNVNAALQNMVFDLPDMNTLPADFKFATVKREDSLFAIVVNADIVDTINGQPSVSVNMEAYGFAVHALLPGTDWRANYFILETSGTGGGGGGAGGYVINTAQDIPNNGTIVLTADKMQWNKVKGDAGPQNANLSPFAAPALPGTVITLEGLDDTDYLMIPHSDTDGGCINPGKGDIYLMKGTTVTYMYDATADRYKSISGNGI